MTMEAENLIMLKHTIENASFDILGYVENKFLKYRSMKRDKRSLQWAKVNGYKYVQCDDDGNINGYGFSRQTLENNNEKNLNIMTIRQYEKATKED